MKVMIQILFMTFCSTWLGLSVAGQITSKMTNLNGLTIEEAIGKLGIPEKCETFLMNDVVGEFHVELFNTYPIAKKENRNVEIKEFNWRDGDYNITLWFHNISGKWIVFESLRWLVGTEF